MLAAWTPAGLTDGTLTFPGDVEVTDAGGAATTPLRAGQPLELTEAPVLIAGLPPDLVRRAAANVGKTLGGDYVIARSVHYRPGFPTRRGDADPSRRQSDGSVRGRHRGTARAGRHQSFAVVLRPPVVRWLRDEGLLRPGRRRVAPGNAGMNLVYEAADGQGWRQERGRNGSVLRTGTAGRRTPGTSPTPASPRCGATISVSARSSRSPSFLATSKSARRRSSGLSGLSCRVTGVPPVLCSQRPAGRRPTTQHDDCVSPALPRLLGWNLNEVQTGRVPEGC